eukprot:869711-Rhodomonas_salina.1
MHTRTHARTRTHVHVHTCTYTCTHTHAHDAAIDARILKISDESGDDVMDIKVPAPLAPTRPLRAVRYWHMVCCDKASGAVCSGVCETDERLQYQSYEVGQCPGEINDKRPPSLYIQHQQCLMFCSSQMRPVDDVLNFVSTVILRRRGYGGTLWSSSASVSALTWAWRYLA